MTVRIAFLALAQAHQIPHWLPAALRLAREPGVEVSVLSASAAALDLVRRHDPAGVLHLRHLRTPALSKDGLFTPPSRLIALALHYRQFRRFDALVTTERSSSVLRHLPGRRPLLIHLMHGAGDRARGYDPRHRHFDLTLVGGQKNRERLLARGLRSPDQVEVVGYAKFELAPPPGPDPAAERFALYNPHFDPALSSWHRHGQAILMEMERRPDWKFVVAPHVKLKAGRSKERHAPNISFDFGSARSIDMTYTNSAHVYIGDVSSQVYEFIHRPRPCIFLNLDRVSWKGDEHYTHWSLGQVVETAADLGPALDRAFDLQPEFEPLQRAAFERSIDPSPVPASERQANTILEFVQARLG